MIEIEVVSSSVTLAMSSDQAHDLVVLALMPERSMVRRGVGTRNRNAVACTTLERCPATQRTNEHSQQKASVKATGGQFGAG